jgi:hypothetical protein
VINFLELKIAKGRSDLEEKYHDGLEAEVDTHVLRYILRNKISVIY